MGLARSWPCFEYWFLLHFCYTEKSYGGTGNRSSCDECTEDLRAPNCWPDYEKNKPGMFAFLLNRLETAMAHADRAARGAATRKNPNPSTEVHHLVRYLQALAEETQA